MGTSKARAYTIARAEAEEAAAAVEIAASCSSATIASAIEVGERTHVLVGMLTKLIRR